jgi:hypothetical protein
MVLGEARQSVRPPFRIASGAGLLPGLAGAPHHQLLVPRRVAAWRARTHPHLTIVGIDDRTALVGDPSRELRVVGVGEVTVRRGAWVRAYPAGAALAPEELGLLPALTGSFDLVTGGSPMSSGPPRRPPLTGRPSAA